jgi:hypothetical protein
VFAGTISAQKLSKDCIAYSVPPINRITPICYDPLDVCEDNLCVYGHEAKTPFGVFTNKSKYEYSVVSTGINDVHECTQMSAPHTNFTQLMQAGLTDRSQARAQPRSRLPCQQLILTSLNSYYLTGAKHLHSPIQGYQVIIASIPKI